MGFKFSFLGDLLSSLETNQVEKASTAARTNNPDIRVVSQWFTQHEKRLRHKDTDQLAVLSCLFPEKLPERVYWLQHSSLARVVGRCLLLGLSRREELERWRVSGGIDLGECVENVMRQAENEVPGGQEVTVEEIDAALIRLASRCKFSGPRVRRQHTAAGVEECLGPLYRRLSSRDAKWLTRMVLKSYSPVVLPANFVLKKFHFLLPTLLLFQDSFDSALKTLASERISRFPPHPEPGLAQDLGAIALECLDPKTGVKIGRPDYYKARSIKHCCRMVDRRRMSIERKYDGEYCQIHIDLSQPQNHIQIFSKSGKDSTMDRSDIHQVLRQSLRIGSPNCRFSRRCILEGELLVWSDKYARIMDFHKLRKFISRSGTFIGTENDSLPQPYEHLMVVFFDVLVLDDDVCLKKPHRERRLLLKDIIQTIDGRADIAEQQILDFSRPDSQRRLEMIFSKAISQRWEGCVLKGCDDPYFSIFPNRTNRSFGRWIKLKKDYIPGLGDTVDLSLIGAKYEPRDATALNRIRKLLWTHFFIGCLVNKEAVVQLGAMPRFRVIDVIDRHCVSLQNMQILNQFGEFTSCSPASSHGFNIEYGMSTLPSMDAVFKTPFVVEMLGSGFEKPSGARYFALRFPRMMKIHWDRAFEDAATYQELQDLADKARAVTAEDNCTEQEQEQEQWSKRLKLANGKAQYIVPRSQSVLSTATSSGSDAEDYDGSGSQGVTIPPNFSNGQGAFNATADPIPIHVDSTAASPSSSSESGLRSNPLTENANPSSHHNFRTRKEVTSTARSATLPINPINNENPSSNGQTTMDTPVTHPRRTESRPRKNNKDNTEISNQASTPTNQQICLKSPLITLPQYLIETSRPTRHHYLPDPSMCIQTLDEFLQSLVTQYHETSLKNSNPYAASQETAMGLVLLTHQRSLGPSLLDIINSVSQSLKENQHQKQLSQKLQHFPPSGKIFFLDSNILNLGKGPRDPRFCLRATWEKIGKVYFYACVSWTTTPPEKPPHYSASASGYGYVYGTKDEIPCTSSLGGDITSSSPSPTTPILNLNQTSVPSITVNFWGDQVHCLGEFSSIEPLVHAFGI